MMKSIDVPDFSSQDLALSAVVLERTPGMAVKNGALDGTLPVAPTTARTFAPTDHVGSYVKINQGGRKSAAPVEVSVRVLDYRDQAAFERTTRLDANAFSLNRTADHRVNLPLDQLSPGKYLLRVDATSGPEKASRFARFSIR
jgi:hypothetical protein